MRLFDIGERIVEGWPVSVDLRRKRMFLDLGMQDSNTTLSLRFGRSLTNLFFPESPHEKVDTEVFKGLWVTRGSLMEDDWGYCLTRERLTESKALARIMISPGIGGRVCYTFGDKVKMVAESTYGGGDTPIPIYLVLLEKGAKIEMHRDGELEDAPPRMSFEWNGIELKLISPIAETSAAAQ